ncbi:hypothetical protein LZ32DRAFT_207076 [Colletotrichum eremochloae]|nr:hypothetical protein LZ32DRAFT_207076 [Colletotrichum eremochloae]
MYDECTRRTQASGSRPLFDLPRDSPRGFLSRPRNFTVSRKWRLLLTRQLEALRGFPYSIPYIWYLIGRTERSWTARWCVASCDAMSQGSLPACLPTYILTPRRHRQRTLQSRCNPHRNRCGRFKRCHRPQMPG